MDTIRIVQHKTPFYSGTTSHHNTLPVSLKQNEYNKYRWLMFGLLAFLMLATVPIMFYIEDSPNSNMNSPRILIDAAKKGI